MTTKPTPTTTVELAMSAGDTIAYEIGARFRAFPGAPREAFADTFERHGFEHVAKILRNITPAKALSATVSRRKAALTADATKAHKAAKGSAVRYEVTELQATEDHQKCWGVGRKLMRAGEASPELVTGARVFITVNGNILAASPTDAAADDECTQIATQLADEAYRLLTVVDTEDASAAIGTAYKDAGAIPWIVRGSYIADVKASRTASLVALINELRIAYYDETSRCGIRASAIPIGEAGGVEALTDAVIDDFEARAAELVANMQRNAGGGEKVRESTLERHRAQCSEFLRDLDGKSDVVGRYFSHLKTIAETVEGAYKGAVKAVDMRVPEWMRRASADEVVQAAPVTPLSGAPRPTEDVAPAVDVPAEPTPAPVAAEPEAPSVAKATRNAPKAKHAAFEL